MATQWEYLVLEFRADTDMATVQAALNETGQDGWEHTGAAPLKRDSVQMLQHYFKRELPAP